jgi:hypothetical protein
MIRIAGASWDVTGPPGRPLLELSVGAAGNRTLIEAEITIWQRERSFPEGESQFSLISAALSVLAGEAMLAFFLP